MEGNDKMLRPSPIMAGKNHVGQIFGTFLCQQACMLTQRAKYRSKKNTKGHLHALISQQNMYVKSIT